MYFFNYRVILAGILRDRKGGVSAIEFTLTAIPVVLMVMAFFQLATLAQTMVALENAAYASARSALVHKCRPFPTLRENESVFGTAKAAWGSITCSDPPDAVEKWTTAAKVALMPVAPSDQRSQYRQGNACLQPDALLAYLNAGAVRQGLSQSLEWKACYVYESGNVSVEVDWDYSVAGVALVRSVPPMTATVTYRVPILRPVQGVFWVMNGSEVQVRPDGTRYIEFTATATVL